MHAILRKRAAASLVAGTLLLGGVGLVAGGVLPVPLDALTTSHAGDAPDDHGPPDDVPRGDEDVDAEGDEVEAQNGEDGPDENADQTAKDVHEAQKLAADLGEDAPPCAHGVYVSAAATGAWDPFDENDDPPEDFPCENAEDGPASVAGDDDDDDDEDDGPPAHAGARGDVDDDGSPGRSGDAGPPGS